MELFDRRAIRRRRDRAASMDPDRFFLIREIAGRLAERLAELGSAYPRALDLGCRRGELARAIADRPKPIEIGTFVQADLSLAMARAARRAGQADGHPVLAADEETLPFAPAAFDLIASCANLHLVNDLPGALLQIRYALAPGGLFLAALFGSTTLAELRQSWLAAETERVGGASPRVAPFATLQDAAELIQRAGFAQPVVDAETIPVSYADPTRLMRDLAGMGESNPLAARRRVPVTKSLLAAAARAYRDQFADRQARVPAHFEILFLTGWAPDR